MALWFELKVNRTEIGLVEISRRENLDLSDPSVEDAVSTYDVYCEDDYVGTVKHRYGDRAWKLLALAAELLAEDDARRQRDANS